MENKKSFLKCDQYEYTAISSKILKRHKTMNHKIHEENDQERAEDLFRPPPPVGPWVSPQTSKEFKTSENVNNSRDFKCDKCDYTASSRDTLKIHKKRKHAEIEDEDVSCEQCDYVADTAEQHVQHIILHQPDPPPVNFIWSFS